MGKYRRGFKTEAEVIAEEIRAELGIGNIKKLPPIRLMKHMEVEAISLTELTTMSQDGELPASVQLLQSEEGGSLSALTVFRGSERFVVYNNANTLERRASDLCHEAAHALLLHVPAVAFDSLGCRAWNGTIEDEAQFLAGTLLIPGKGARYAAKAGWSIETIANHFGCSTEMAQWRYNTSGGQRINRLT